MTPSPASNPGNKRAGANDIRLPLSSLNWKIAGDKNAAANLRKEIMKTEIVQVQVGSRIESFANCESAKNYCRKWGGKILANEDPGAGAARPIAESDHFPTPSPGLCNLLGLSTTSLAEPSELKAAWESNGRRSSPADHEKIKFALVNYWRGKRGGDIDDALNFLKARHPLLFPEQLHAAAAGTSANEMLLSANEVMLGIGPTMRYAA